MLCHTRSVGHVTVGMTKGFLVSFPGHLFPVTINKVKNKLTRDLFKLLRVEFLCESNFLELISMLTITDSFLETWQQHQLLAFSPTCHELVDDSSFFSVDQLFLLYLLCVVFSLFSRLLKERLRDDPM